MTAATLAALVLGWTASALVIAALLERALAARGRRRRSQWRRE